jgi:hypothetical protein
MYGPHAKMGQISTGGMVGVVGSLVGAFSPTSPIYKCVDWFIRGGLLVLLDECYDRIDARRTHTYSACARVDIRDLRLRRL